MPGDQKNKRQNSDSDESGKMVDIGLESTVLDNQVPEDLLQETELPGDSVCWLRLVCQECGSMAEAPPQAKCPQCGAQLDVGR